MTSTPRTGAARPPRTPRSSVRVAIVVTIVVIAVLVVAFFAFAALYSDVLWFQQLGYLGVLTTGWYATLVMFAIGFVLTAGLVWLNLAIAHRTRPVYAKLNAQLDRYAQVLAPLRRLATIGIPLLLGLFVGASMGGAWQTVLQYFNRTSFGTTDPQFGLDVSFFVYELPFYHGALGYASAIVLITGLVAFAATYLYGGVRITGREVRVTRAARIQLAVLLAVYLALQAVSIWFDQYSTATDESGLVTGALFTDVNALIPGRAILAGIAGIVALIALATAVIGRWRLPVIGVGLLIVSALVIGSIYPAIIERFQVTPSAQQLEAPYIQRNINATRDAYGVADVAQQSYTAKTDAEAGALRQDATTTANIRILDPSLVSSTFAQLQQVKQYYQFEPHLDVDRYDIDGKTQDTVIAVRELNQSNQNNQSWVNDALVYTHGYGVVAAYGNQRTTNGEPVFLESDIPSTGALGDFEPRVYFGEASPNYSIVGAPQGAKPQELDYPSGTADSDANAYYTYQGDGGPKLDSLLNRLVYAVKFGSEEILLSGTVGDYSQILYDRDPKERVQKVAPYLTLDSDPYPAVVDGHIEWIVDGYTTTADYPYSQVGNLKSMIADTYTPQPQYPFGDEINYIRNSVKATVDAYTGKVTLYAWDDQDPLLQTWEKIYPGTIQPRSAMSADLLAHIRYPEDLFKVQRSILQTYHVTDPNSFYSNDDAWSTPDDPTGQSGTPQPPYYLTMQVPGTDKPAFTLYSTYIPRSTSDTNRSVLTGYLTVDSDAGPDYGKLTLLTLPKQDTVPGPGQAQNQFNSDPDVANQLNILGRGDSTVIRGNLLTLPVGGGLLYVQPVYVKSNGETSYPLLRKVLVAFGDKVAFEDTLDAALDQLFGGDSGATAGDNGVPGETTTPPPTTGTGTTPPTAGAGDNAALQQALSDYQQALADRNAAYAKGDLVAAAQADERMQAAVERAIQASGAGQ